MCIRDRTWSIPLVIRHDDGTTPVVLDRQEMVLPGVRRAPLTLSEGANAFVRTEINVETLPDPGALSAAERHAVIDDAWATCVSGALAATDFLAVCQHFARERELNVWQAISTGLHGLDRLVDEETRPAFQQMVRAMAEPVLSTIRIEPDSGDDDRTRELRATLFRLLGTVGGSAEVIARAAESLDHEDPSLAAAALTVVSSTGDDTAFETIRARWKQADDPQSETRHLRALANFPSIDLVDRLLVEIRDGTVRTQDAPYVLARALHNRATDRYVWAFIRDHWDDLDRRFPSNAIPRMLSGITALDQADLVTEVGDFLDRHPIPQAGKQVEQHRERQTINARLRDRESKRFCAALR